MAPWHNWQLSQSLPIDSIAAQIIIMGAIIDTLEKKQRLKCHHHYCHYGWHESSKSGVAHGVWLVKISDWDDPKNSLTFQWYHTKNSTVFENHRKSLIQYWEQFELILRFEWTKVHQKCQKWSILGKKKSHATFLVNFKHCVDFGNLKLRSQSWMRLFRWFPNTVKYGITF